MALALPSVTGESWHSPVLGSVRIPRCHTGQQSEPGPPLCRSSHILPLGEVLGAGEGQVRPAAARMPSRELATALCSARNRPSEAWASWGMFVGKEEEDSAAIGSRLWLLWGLARACWALGYGTRAPWVSPGRLSPLNCNSLSCPQPARSGALGRRRPQRASSYLCASWTPSPPALTPSRSFWAGPESSLIPDLQPGLSALDGRPRGLWVPVVPRPVTSSASEGGLFLH